MQEFSSVIASSYDAESLAPMLTEKASEGWSVVSIVSAGTNVVAYLTRGGDSAGAAPASTGAAAATGAAAVVGVAAVAATSAPDEVSVTEIEVDEEAAAGVAADATAISPSLPGEDAPAAEEPVVSTPEAVAAVEASGEPSGWGAVTDTPSVPDTPDTSSVPDADDSGLGAAAIGAAAVGGIAVGGAALAGDATSGITSAVDSAGDAATGTADAAGSAAGDAGAGLTDSIGDATSEAADTEIDATAGATEAATAEAVETTGDDAAAASGVPAGWYADPSGRFELRYWDGSAWTEHVSRAGQQYTDPPVA